jgi:hypothetical protein
MPLGSVRADREAFRHAAQLRPRAHIKDMSIFETD